MQIKFSPKYIISPKIINALLRIEEAKVKAEHLPLNPTVLASLRETAKLYTTHYSTMIEGNNLTPNQVESVLKHAGHFPGRERDEHEVKGYYAALNQVEQWVTASTPITESILQQLHALVMAGGKTKVKPTPYRDGQNVIRDSQSRALIYMPPEAKDVPGLMHGLVDWLNQRNDIPYAIKASLAHYQFATIHPYYDGNGRTARLLTTLILHVGGYDLKGLYALEEYYARNLGAYYQAISVGDSHNYYMGRAEADLTDWIEYFIEGMAFAFEKVIARMELAKSDGSSDQSALLRKLDPSQRKALQLFKEFDTVTSQQIGALFGFKPRTSAQTCANWVTSGFLQIANPSNKSRKYILADQYRPLI